MHDHKVARQDAEAQHRLAAHAQGKVFALPSAGIEGQIVLDALLREDRAAGRHVPDDRHLRRLRRRKHDGLLLLRPGLRLGGFGRLAVHRNNGAALERTLFNVAQLREVLQVKMHRRRGFEPHCVADVADRRRVAVLRQIGKQKLVDSLLHLGPFAHCLSLP